MLAELGLSATDEEVYRNLLAGSLPNVPDKKGPEKKGPDADGSDDNNGPDDNGPDDNDPDEASSDETRESLDRLRELGFVDGDQAVPPSTAIRAFLHRKQAELHQQAAELEQVRARADELGTRFLASVPGQLHGIEVLTDRDEIARRVAEVVASATSEVLVLDRPPYAKPGKEGVGETDPLDRGVRVRVVFATEGLDFPGRMASIAGLVENGLEARVLDDVPTKLIVVDRRIAVLPPSDVSDPTTTALVVLESMLLNALVPLWEQTWERAVPLGVSTDPDVVDRELLALLASGLKDEAIARQLGVHVHTARRRISRLLERLDATSRFQAGVQASRRNWLD